MKKLLLLVSVLMIIALLSCNNTKQTDSGQNSSENTEHKGQASVEDTESAANALSVAKSLPDFTTLVAAIEAAGVEDAVVNAGPLTVFAPTNAAFDKLPKGTVDDLLKSENKSKLAYILTNHVAPANYPDVQLIKEAEKGRKLYMASGQYLEVKKTDEGISVGGIKILKTVKVSNGWIHVIDDVLVPVE